MLLLNGFLFTFFTLCHITVLCRVLNQLSFAGVLNPEELSLINKTFKKSNETPLAVIEEDESVRSSLGSNCSLGEDDSALQCLEEKLFAELQTSKPKIDNQADKIHNAASCETFPAQPLGLPQFNVTFT